jgi:membrane-associated phospholipid phosphatase
MTVKLRMGICLGTIPLMVFSYFFLDDRLALFCKDRFLNPTAHHFFPVELPDLLFPIVCLATVLAWVAVLVFKTHHSHNTALKFFLLIGITVPGANVLKAFAKFLVGRVTTRYWLANPTVPHFQWLNGTDAYCSFPSGHMAVFTVLAAALDAHFPRFRSWYWGGLILLALALIATDYHFLSDVLGGACLGLLLHAGAFAALDRRPALRGRAEIT